MALVRVVPLKDFLATALSTSQDGATPSTQAPVYGNTLYAALHLTQAYASTGRVLRATVQSASSSGFSSPTTEIEFTRSTAVGAQVLEASSLSTDRPWRRATFTASTAGGSTGGEWKGLVYAGLY